MTGHGKFKQIAQFMKEMNKMTKRLAYLEKKTKKQQQIIDGVTLDRDDLVEELQDLNGAVEKYKSDTEMLQQTVDECKDAEIILKDQVSDLACEVRKWKSKYEVKKEEVEYYKSLKLEPEVHKNEDADDSEFIVAKRNDILAKQKKKKLEWNRPQDRESDSEEEDDTVMQPREKRRIGKMLDKFAKQNPEAFDLIFEPVDEFAEKMFSDEED